MAKPLKGATIKGVTGTLEDSVSVFSPKPQAEAPVPAEPSSGQIANSSALILLKPLAEVASVFLALSFVAGWSYLSSYYNAFGLNPLELDISASVAAMFALHVIYQSVWPLIIVGIFTALLIFGRRYSPSGAWVLPAVGAAICLLAVTGIWRGRKMARSDLFEDTSRLPNVAFVTSLKADGPACVTEGALSCKLLLHSKGLYYVFEPVRANADALDRSISTDDAAPNFELFAIPETQVQQVRIQRGYQ
jgi:hypothetical protein